MTGNTAEIDGPRRSGRRLAAWGALTALLLMVPLVAMRFTSEVNWTFFDFVFAAVLIFGSGAAFELVTRRATTSTYKAGAALAVLASLLLIWVNGAVGIIGSENNNANLLYGGVLLIVLLGSLASRFRAAGMAATMLTAGLAQVAIGVVAVLADLGTDGAIWPRDVIGATILFAAMWLLSAGLFRAASRN